MSSASKVSADLRPTDHEYALLSQHVYKKGKARPIEGTPFITMYRGWKVVLTKESPSGYFGSVYRCDTSKQFVIAHKGTSGFSDLYEDIHGVLFNKYSAQKDDAFLLVNLIIHQIRVHRPDYKISFTGHSLGAFLAELSVYYAVNSLDFPHVNAVTFESPGSKQSMKLQIEHDVIHLGKKTPISKEQIQKLDIVTYLCYPNLVNSCNEHVGTVYTINPDLPGGSIANLPVIRLLSSHKIQGIVDWFNEAYVKNNIKYTRQYMANWPNGYKQMRIFFKHAMLKNKMLSVDPELIQPRIPPPPISSQEYDQCGKEDTASSMSSIISSHSSIGPHDHSKCIKFEKWLKGQKDKIKLQYYGNFRVIETQNTFHTLPLHHFCHSFQHFLKYFFEKLNSACGSSTKMTQKLKESLAKTWKAFDMPEDVSRTLLTYSIRVNSICIEEIVCGSTSQSAHDFRQIVSCWLEKSGFTADDLINDSILEEFALKSNQKKYVLLPPIPTYHELQIQKTSKESKNKQVTFRKTFH